MDNKMKEWLEANQEIYAEFKSKIHSTLDILSQDGTNVAECDETYSLQNMLLEAMAAKNMPVENIINTFSKAAEEGDMAACCMHCYLELDNGFEEIESAMTKFEQSTDAQYIKDGLNSTCRIKSRKLKRHQTEN